MKRRFVVAGLAGVLAVSLAVPALGGPSNPIAEGAASAKKTADKALKKAKKSNKKAKANSTALGELPVVWGAKVDADATGASLLGGDGATGVSRLGVGQFKVTFEGAITGCAWVSNLNRNGVGPAPPGMTSVEQTSADDPSSLTVRVYNTSTPPALVDPLPEDGFSLEVICPPDR